MNMEEPLRAPIPTAIKKIMVLSYRDLLRHGSASMPSGAENEHAEIIAIPSVHAEEKFPNKDLEKKDTKKTNKLLSSRI